MMSLDPYLYFDGDCRAAFDFYKSVFGGEFEPLMTYGDGPEGMPVPEGAEDRIMHVSLPIGSSVLMGSDAMDASGHIVGTNIHVSHGPASREACDREFAALAKGGTITMPLADQFWGAYFGNLTDKFGINWMFNYREG
jgi:PhnB protein